MATPIAMARLLSYVLLALCIIFGTSAHKNQQTLRPHERESPKPEFESPEHWAIGNKIKLRFPNRNILGAEYNHTVQDGYNTTLSFGEILALAGDFYANYALRYCPAQISDNGTEAFLAATEYLQHASNSFPWYTLSNVLYYIRKQGKEVAGAPDPAWEYDRGEGYQSITNWGFSEQFWRVTGGGYLAIALCNWDHFGKDARTTYAIGHAYAIEMATSGNGTAEERLDRAYFFEAFSAHFVTDLFSAGHLRTPRRRLHGWYGARDVVGVGLFSWDPWPADHCSQAMHDEDSANGLWVTNEHGESWAAYGDKQYILRKNAENVRRLQAAVQAGVDEVWRAFNGEKVELRDYEAMKLAPIVEHMDPASNFAPLFKSVDNSTVNGTNLLFREPELRNSATYTNLTSHLLPLDNWTIVYDSIAASGPWRDMYALNMDGFLPHTEITQLRQANDTHLVVNHYGPQIHKDASSDSKSWNMLSQTIIPTGFCPGESVEWWSAKKLAPGFYVLNGRLNGNEVHMGISDDDRGVRILWRDVISDGEKCDEVQYGSYSIDSTDLAMIKLCGKQFELWVIPSRLSKPVRQETTWPVTFVPQTFSMASGGFHATSGIFVAAGLDTTSNTFKWLFMRWSDGYNTQRSRFYEEHHVDYPATALINIQTSNKPAPGFIRLSYGTGHGAPGMLQLDMLMVTPDLEVVTFSKQEILITWGRQDAASYLHWFLQKLAPGDRFPSLVGYLDSKTSDDLMVLTFGWNETGWDGPRIDILKSEETGVGKRFNGKWFKTLGVVDTWGAGIVEVLDYYGVLGVRYVGIDEDRAWSVQGQVPAVAGQGSAGLGVEVMANGRERAIGYFFEERHYWGEEALSFDSVFSFKV